MGKAEIKRACALITTMAVLFTLMNTASKLGPHTQTDRGTCPGVSL